MLPIVLVHGIRTSSTMWRAQVASLSIRGYMVSAPDLPGHGSRLGERFTLEAAYEAIDAAVDHFDQPVLLVGLSLGGYLSITYAARQPDKVAGLIAASCLALPRGLGLAAYRRLAGRIVRSPDQGRRLNRRLARTFLPPAGAYDVAAGGMAPAVMEDALREMGSTDPIADLRAYPGPVWLVTGALDHFRLNEAQFRAARPDAAFVVVPRATHLLSLVAPRAFTQVVVDAAAQLDSEVLVAAAVVELGPDRGDNGQELRVGTGSRVDQLGRQTVLPQEQHARSV